MIAQGASAGKVAAVSEDVTSWQAGDRVGVDTADADVAEALQALGGADLVVATAPNAEAICAAFGGLKARGKGALPFGADTLRAGAG